ncbi:hypothetical protein [Paracoccus sanguinis]|uniref:hypothetical protein n=1 Tax=Paracoccus sanguinis TaxID=1545044 RepID=UPI00051FE1B5|nr:hypothetical protein [Paracoccus sanguinis]KGJ15752.1 hypothetical protein IX54_00450 [Paracoccus sanguinis]
MSLPPVPPPDLLKRLPGYYRRWELTELVIPDRYYFFEAAGQHGDGEDLFAVYVQPADMAPGEGRLQ